MSIVEIRIAYCPVCWGYRSHAEVLANLLRGRFGANVKVVSGTVGQFDVFVDNKVVATRGRNLLARIKPPRLPGAAAVIAAIERHILNEDDNPDLVNASNIYARKKFLPADAKRFYDRFGTKQDAQFYELPALEELLNHADFEHATAVFEFGCGTGRFAMDCFEKRLPEHARYIGIDISTTMVEIATRRLERWSERAKVQQGDGTANGLPYANAAFDRFVATYVFDLLPEPLIRSVLGEAHRLLGQDGKLCVVTFTEGIGPRSRIVGSVWKGVYAVRPSLVGGCRPLHITEFLDRNAWHIEDQQTVSSWGICSDVIIASPVAKNKKN